MTQTKLAFVPAALLLCASASGFAVGPSCSRPFGLATSRPQSSLYLSSTPSFISNKFYQLEEMEDKDDCTTEVFLKDDGSITLGETDGPPPLEYSGSWQMEEGSNFKMTLTRKFETGEGKSRPTDMGEFDYEVKRIYTGNLDKVGGELAITGGKMHNIHEELGDEEVGYFNILDTNDAKAGK